MCMFKASPVLSGLLLWVCTMGIPIHIFLVLAGMGNEKNQSFYKWNLKDQALEDLLVILVCQVRAQPSPQQAQVIEITIFT